MSGNLSFYTKVTPNAKAHTCDINIIQKQKTHLLKNVKYYTGLKSLVMRFFGQTIAVHHQEALRGQPIFYVNKKQVINSAHKYGFSPETITSLLKQGRLKREGPLVKEELRSDAPTDNKDTDSALTKDSALAKETKKYGGKNDRDNSLAHQELYARRLKPETLAPNPWEWLKQDLKCTSDEALRVKLKKNVIARSDPIYQHYGVSKGKNRVDDYALAEWELDSRNLDEENLNPNPWAWLKNDYKCKTDDQLRSQIKQNKQIWKNPHFRQYGVKNFEDFHLVRIALFAQRLEAKDLKPNPWEKWKLEFGVTDDNEMRKRLNRQIDEHAAQVNNYGGENSGDYRLVCREMYFMGHNPDSLKPTPWACVMQSYEATSNEELREKLESELNDARLRHF
jgi:hypothetical protein